MISQIGKKINIIHEHLKLSKPNQTMTFGQLIEYNTRNTFFGKSYTNAVEKLVLDPSIKNQN